MNADEVLREVVRALYANGNLAHAGAVRRAMQEMIDFQQRSERINAALDASRSVCKRIIEQDGGVLGGVNFHCLLIALEKAK